jgi:uncharacterized protein with PQ loop repeat
MDFYNFKDNFILWSLILGCFISYIPQYKKIYDNKNTLGINELMVISGFFSCYFNVIGSIQENLQLIKKCENNCYLPIIQISTPMICSLLLYVLYIIYYNNRNKNEFMILETDIIMNYIKIKRNVKIRSLISLLFSIIIFIGSILLNRYESFEIVNCSGKIFNILSAVLSFIMWCPQLYTTYKLKNHHSLSLLTLFIHSLGCLIIIFYQLIFAKQEFWIILCFIVSFLSEITLFIMSLYYKKKNKLFYHMIL